MKKAESHKTTYSTAANSGGFSSPMPPASGSAVAPVNAWADPSSAARSNRYPVPTLGDRGRQA